jgi:dipeptide/tripeptide permease
VQTAAQEIDADSEKPLPTEEENATLRKVADNLPWVSFSLCLVEFAERASYYGAKTVYANFIEYPLPEGIFNSHNIKFVLRHST